jgi:hypothetical protein
MQRLVARGLGEGADLRRSFPHKRKVSECYGVIYHNKQPLDLNFARDAREPDHLSSLTRLPTFSCAGVEGSLGKESANDARGLEKGRCSRGVWCCLRMCLYLDQR